MAGEFNATNTVVQNSSGVIVGQGAFTHTYAGTLIPISNKSFQDTVFIKFATRSFPFMPAPILN